MPLESDFELSDERYSSFLPYERGQFFYYITPSEHQMCGSFLVIYSLPETDAEKVRTSYIICSSTSFVYPQSWDWISPWILAFFLDPFQGVRSFQSHRCQAPGKSLVEMHNLKQEALHGHCVYWQTLRKWCNYCNWIIIDNLDCIKTLLYLNHSQISNLTVSYIFHLTKYDLKKTWGQFPVTLRRGR